MGRPDFGGLVAALKTGAAKGERFQSAKPGNFDGARDRKWVSPRDLGARQSVQISIKNQFDNQSNSRISLVYDHGYQLF
jgi:hypothetical protein